MLIRFFCLLLCLPAPLFANDSSADPDSFWQDWEFGVLVGFGKKYNPIADQEDLKQWVIPSVAYYGEHFFFDNGDIGYLLFDQSNIEINLFASYSDDSIWFTNNKLGRFYLSSVIPDDYQQPKTFNSKKTSHTPFKLTRQSTYLGGIEILTDTKYGLFYQQYLYDLLSVHHGGQINLGWRQQWQWSLLSLGLSCGIEWKSHKLTNYYYGVKTNDEFGEKIIYQAEQSINPVMKLQLTYTLSKQFDLILMANYFHFGREIDDSPIVIKDNSQQYFVGFGYHF